MDGWMNMPGGYYEVCTDGNDTHGSSHPRGIESSKNILYSL
jgi:hypothetical protein